MNLEFISFITDVIIPVVVVFYILSLIGKAAWNERVLYELIGLLSTNNVLSTSDLARLHIFEPREDAIEHFVKLLRG